MNTEDRKGSDLEGEDLKERNNEELTEEPNEQHPFLIETGVETPTPRRRDPADYMM